MATPVGNKKLRHLRLDEKAWTLEQLAKEAGVSPQTVRKAERGLPVRDVTMARIAKALGTSVDLLFPRAGRE